MKKLENIVSKIATKSKDKLDQLEHQLQTRFYQDINFSKDYKNSVILLAGVSRSGTTWVSNIINYDNSYRYIFEPFKHNKVELFQHCNPKLYLRPESKMENFSKAVETVLTGKLRNEWADKFNKKILSHKRLIKAIHSNLFLKWLHCNFPNVPIILLMRHPCAVAVSKSKLGFEMGLDCYLIQDQLMEDYLHPFQKQLEDSNHYYKKTGYAFDNYIFNWCIENYVPLKQFAMNEIHILFYEQLCEQPDYTVSKMFQYLGRKYDSKSLASFSKPSLVTRKDSAINKEKTNLIDWWKKDVSEAQMDRCLEILNLFGLGTIYSSNPMPNVEKLEEFMG